MEEGLSDKGVLGNIAELVDDKMNKDESEIAPKVGMTFSDVEEMYGFWKNYAKHMGFPVRKRTNKKDEEGIIRYVTFTCAREGKRGTTSNNPLKPPPSTKTGCRVKLSASLDRKNKWRINVVILEHNHELCPSKCCFFRCHRSSRVHEDKETTILNINSSVVENGGFENFTFFGKDSRNNVEKVRQLRLGEGDALAMQNYFLKMQAQNTGFFFSMDLDEGGRLKNVFWADGRSREAYKEFGEVVTFDTTYLSNKYCTPLTSFVGVNHHGQLTLFGCGLVSNEDIETFVWLFRTWLVCMADNAPKGMITDQDEVMQSAIEIVFPNIRHRWCLWHITKKLFEKLGKDYESIKFDLQSVVHDTQSPEEFERSWIAMVDGYALHQNQWLSELYNERRRWVPCFVKTGFWAGMSTTQRTESVNVFFDGYVNSKTTLKQFVEQYENALRCKVEKESQLDFRSFSHMVPCATTYEMEKQVQGVYTISKFKEFQEELTGKMYCEVISIRESDVISEYDIREDVAVGEGRKRMIFMISFHRNECTVECSCNMFEFRGILCRHAISVLIRNDVALLPDKYILRRWRKDMLRSHMRVRISYDGLCTTPEQLRYDKMCLGFTKVADLAADDEVRYSRVMEWIDNQSKELSTKRLRLSSGNNATRKLAVRRH